MIWTSEYLNSLALEAEIQIAEEVPCIIDRLSLDIKSGISEYQLPEYVSDIRKITWEGFKLDATAQIEYPNWVYLIDEASGGAFNADAFTDAYFIDDRVIAGTPQGKPFRYFYSTFGENKVVFNPGPNKDIAILTDELWNTDLDKGVIVEFYRMPDGYDWKLPSYIRQRTIKAYIMSKAFAKEGDGQNLKASQYWAQKYQQLLARARSIIWRIHSAELRTRTDQVSNGTIARPVLPANWNVITVDDCDCE